jgi:hypothetical protein
MIEYLAENKKRKIVSVNALADYEFRMSVEGNAFDDVKAALKAMGKKWCFQKEQGDSGYVHWQGNISLIKKRRPAEIHNLWKKLFADGELPIDFPNHFEPLSNNARGSTSNNPGESLYSLKLDTRIEGPWKDTDKEIYIPYDVRELMEMESFPSPWQRDVIDMLDVREIRKVDIIIDKDGGKGKSSLVRYLGCQGKAKKIPFANDFKDVMRMVMDMPTQKMYFIDMPRAIGKERLYQLYGAIEEIKGGYAFDDRYSFKDKYFDPPRVIVITNTAPDLNLLSADRWKLWEIDPEEGLVPASGIVDVET